jgi:hypothetical protein
LALPRPEKKARTRKSADGLGEEPKTQSKKAASAKKPARKKKASAPT